MPQLIHSDGSRQPIMPLLTLFHYCEYIREYGIVLPI